MRWHDRGGGASRSRERCLVLDDGHNHLLKVARADVSLTLAAVTARRGVLTSDARASDL